MTRNSGKMRKRKKKKGKKKEKKVFVIHAVFKESLSCTQKEIKSSPFPEKVTDVECITLKSEN